MSDLVVKDVPEAVVHELERRAASHGRSAEAELRAVLVEQFRPPAGNLWGHAGEFREELRSRGLHFDSAKIIRQDRDSR